MSYAALVVFTARPLEWIVREGGSGNWRLDADRARSCQYLVCTQNRHNLHFGAPTAPHRAAFLIGRIADVVPAAEEPDRWVVRFSEYAAVNIPNIWGKLGNMRYPVLYSTLEDLEVDPGALPPMNPAPPLQGMGERPWRPLPLPVAGATSMSMGTPAGEDDAWRRFDATLAQLDRVPDLPAAADPLAWDEYGLPQ